VTDETPGVAKLEEELAMLDEQLARYHEQEDRLSDIIEGAALDQQGLRDLDRLGGDRDALVEEYEEQLYAVLHYSDRLEAVRGELARRLARAREEAGQQNPGTHLGDAPQESE
jgi:hypothetical protein